MSKRTKRPSAEWAGAITREQFGAAVKKDIDAAIDRLVKQGHSKDGARKTVAKAINELGFWCGVNQSPLGD